MDESDPDLDYLVSECKETFERENPDKKIIIIRKDNYETKVIDFETYIKLFGRPDGLVIEKSTETLIGIFRVRVQYPNHSINDDHPNYSDRLQLYMFLYNTERAFTMTICSETETVLTSNETNIDQDAVNQLLEDVRLNSKMNPINSYDKYLQEAFTLCKKEIEAAHPGKVVEIIKATDYKTMVMGIADKTYILYGRADGIVHSSTTKIGIFRLWVQFSSPASQKEVIDFEDRIQLYLFLHNLPVAYVMDYVRYSKKFQNAREIHRNETRIQELLEEVRKTIDAAEFDDISVSTFLKNRGTPTNKESKEEN